MKLIFKRQNKWKYNHNIILNIFKQQKYLKILRKRKYFQIVVSIVLNLIQKNSLILNLVTIRKIFFFF